MGLSSIEKLGPLTVRGSAVDCDICPIHLLAATNTAAVTMAKRHWLLAHPEWEDSQ